MIIYGLAGVRKGEDGLAGAKIIKPILPLTVPCYSILTLRQNDNEIIRKVIQKNRKEISNEMKKRIFAILVLVIVVISASGCFNREKWEKFVSTEGGFSAQFPGAPIAQKIEVETEFGKTFLNLFILFKKEDNVLYTVSYLDCPPQSIQGKSINTMLNDSRDKALAAVKGKLLSESNITFHNSPGKELKVESSTGIITSRFFIINYRLYQIMIRVPKERFLPGNVKKFINSFKLLYK